MRDNCLVWQTHTCLSFPTSDRDQHIATYKSFFYVKRLSHAQGTGLKMKKKTKSTTLLYWCNSQQWLLVVSCNFPNLTFQVADCESSSKQRRPPLPNPAGLKTSPADVRAGFLQALLVWAGQGQLSRVGCNAG